MCLHIELLRQSKFPQPDGLLKCIYVKNNNSICLDRQKVFTQGHPYILLNHIVLIEIVRKYEYEKLWFN